METGFPGAKTTVAFFEWFGDLGMFCGRLIATFFVPPYEVREFVRQFDELGSKSLPLAALAGAATGVVLSLSTRDSLIPIRRISSTSGTPASACFKTVTICSTLNRFCFTATPPSRGTRFCRKLTFKVDQKYRGRSLSGWNIDRVFYNIVGGIPVEKGVVMIVKNGANSFAITIQKEFAKLGIEFKGAIDPNQEDNPIALVVGQKQ
jgi:hypothetical protein